MSTPTITLEAAEVGPATMEAADLEVGPKALADQVVKLADGGQWHS